MTSLTEMLDILSLQVKNRLAIFVVSFFLAMLLIGCRQGERPANNAEVEEEMEKQ